LLASALVPVAAAFSLLCLVLAPGEAARGLLAPWRAAFASGAPDLAFYRNLAGLDEPGGHVLSMLPFAFGALAVLVPAAGLDLLLRARPRTRAVAAGIVFALVAVGLSALGVDWLRALRPLPLFLLGLLAWLVGRRLRGAEPGPSAALVALAVLSLALLAKILLGTWAAHYGFALALPGTLVLVATLFCFVPRALRRAGGSGIVFRAAALALVALFVTGHLRLAADALAGNTHAVGSGPDRFLADGRGADLSQVIDLIERAFPPDATVAVLPEGVMLNYLMRRPNPTPYVNFMPPELLFFGEDAMVAAFDARPPDAVVLWHKDTSEYGLPLFGSDYGLSLWAWLRSHYRVVATFGAAPLRRPSLYGLQVLSRNDAPMPTLPGALPAVDPR
jgi:hypothetical protein